jgi:Trk K+ transport system NAD-binding subunit
LVGKQSIVRRTVFFLISVFTFVLLASRLYGVGMYFLEGQPRGFWECLMTVVETLTTTGYGSDSHWDHPVMNAYIIVLQLSGICIFFLIFPLYFLPFLENRFEQKLPIEDLRIKDHILIFKHSQAISTVLPELERLNKPLLIIEDDEPEARRLVEMGHHVIHRQLDDEALAAAGLLRAQVLIANGGDGENASLALAARQLGFEGEILSFVTDSHFVEPLLVAGSDDVLAPRNLLAVALAARASERVSPTIAGAHQLGQQLEIYQIRIQPDCQIAGLTLVEAAIGARTGAIVIGQWIGGKLR